MKSLKTSRILLNFTIISLNHFKYLIKIYDSFIILIIFFIILFILFYSTFPLNLLNLINIFLEIFNSSSQLTKKSFQI